MVQTTGKRKTTLLGLALGSLIATGLEAGTVTATEGGTAAKGFFAKRFSNVCTSALFSKANFGPTLKGCVKNYPEDMRKLQEELKLKNLYS